METEPQKDSIVTAEKTFADDAEFSLRPRFLKDFLGQDENKANLKVYIEAAKSRNESLDHLFLIGPPGLGKTTLAQITANELGVEAKITSAPALDKPKDLVGILTTLSEHSVFFIDEIHRLKPTIQEMLYIAMEDYEIDWIVGQGPAARTFRLPIPPFTLIGATTKAGVVSSPLASRFGIILQLNFYTDEELAKVITRSAKLLNIAVDASAALLLAGCSRGTPRIANRLVRRMRDFAHLHGKNKIDDELVRFGLERLGVDSLGLEECDRRILRSIIENYAGGPVGSETLALSVGETQDTLEDYYEPYLIRCGLLQRTPRGRVVTAKTYEHLGLKADTPSLF